jgi:hypothetical protein
VLAAIGGLLVFVALFLEWFAGASAWEAFEALDLVIAVLALLAVAAGVASASGSAGFAVSPRALPWIGALLLAIVAVQLIEPPPVFAGGDPERDAGGWLALAGSGLVLLGGVLRAARISVTVSVGARDARARVPAVDRRPAGGAAAASGSGAAAAPPLATPSDDDQATQPFAPTSGTAPPRDP